MNNPVKNTNEKGIVEFTIFQEGKTYVGVCLYFDNVIKRTDYNQLKKDIFTAAQLHVETVKANNLSEDLLNRPAPKEYWDKRGSFLVPAADNQTNNKSALAKPGMYEAQPYSKTSKLAYF